MSMDVPVLYTPTPGWVGDVIPAAIDGEVYLYFLHEERVDPKPGTPWRLVTTRDFVRLADRGVVLPGGGPDAEDFNAYTGSVVEGGDGVIHLFYTGQNPSRLGSDGQPVQVVCHATSTDGLSWLKHPEDSFGAPDGYESADWRDPFVFRDDRTGVWRMLVAARHTSGAPRRRGTVAQMVSRDLTSWEPVEPFWDPRRFITHECPEVFEWGGWWYLVYSEFSERFATRYRMAQSLDGPWLAPTYDTIDGRAFYAAKSVAHGQRRYFVGWIATKEGEVDDGAWQWAGSMSALEATQNPDGTLAFALPEELVTTFDRAVPNEPFVPLLGALRAPDRYASRISESELPSRCLVRVEFAFNETTSQAGVMVRTSVDGDVGYEIRLEPLNGRMVLDRWPRRRTGDAQWQVSGDVAFELELERECALPPGIHQLEICLDDDAMVAVLDRQVTLSSRLYDHATGRLGVFVADGALDVRSVEVLSRSHN